MWPQWLTDALTGRTSLQRAFWLYGLGGTVAYSAAGLLFPETPLGIGLYLGIGLVLGVLQSVILWRCAPNSRSSLARRLTRAAIVVGLVVTVVVLYVMFAFPDILATAGLNRRGG